jgi:hypothetical protein
MELWTDIISPADLTGYAREALADYELTQGSLAPWLPYREVADIAVRFVKGQNGLIDVANFRAYDAEIEIGKREAGERVMLELPALGQNIPVSEYEQLRARGGDVSPAQALITIQNTTRIVVRAVADAMELLRGVVLQTGKSTVHQDNFQMDDDFGRDPRLTFTAPALWSLSNTDRLGQLQDWCDLYEDINGAPPGAMLMARRPFRGLAAGDQFQTQLLNGGARNATDSQVRDTISSAGLPPIYLNNRRVSKKGVATKVLDDNKILLLPAPVAPDDWEGTELGASFWGRTLTSLEANWGIEAARSSRASSPAVYRNAEAADGHRGASPTPSASRFWANANLSMCVTVM